MGVFLNCFAFITYILTAPDLITAAIDETCGCIAAITYRRPLVYIVLKLLLTAAPRYLVSHNIDTGEALDDASRAHRAEAG
jgi:hypothetical protein